MDARNTVSIENSADEMGDLEKIQKRLLAHRWLLMAIVFVFIALIVTNLLDVFTALLSILALFAAAALAPRQSNRAQASTVATEYTDLDDRSFAYLDVIPDPVMLIGPTGLIEYTNAEFISAFGELAEGSSSLLRFRSPEIQTFIQSLIEGEPAAAIEYSESEPIARWFLVSAQAVERDEFDRRILVHFRDLSETKQTAKVRSDFIANASHELRTPLASLTGFIETLSGPARNDEKARDRFLKIMQEQAERMSRLIDDLLTLSRIETGKGKAQFEKVDLRGPLLHVIDALRPMAQGTNTEINSKITDEKQAIFVHGSGDELIQLFENLIENAIKYGGSNGTVVINLNEAENENEITVEVSDSGPGIPEEHIPRLVERFYRVDIETSRGKQGTGLGLSIVKHIVQRHGGRLNIRSKIGEGSTFVVTLPTLGDREA